MSELTNEDIKQRIENRNKLREQLDRTGGILDVGAIYEGAKRAEEERAERQRELRERSAARNLEEQKKAEEFMIKVGQSVEKSKKEKADLEIKKAKSKADKELAAKIRNQNGLLSDEEEALDNSYRSMLNSLNKNK